MTTWVLVVVTYGALAYRVGLWVCGRLREVRLEHEELER